MKRVMASMLGLALAVPASAVEFCHGGYVQQVADIVFSGQDLYDWADAHLPQPPPAVNDLDFWIASHAAAQACSVYSGWSGRPWGVIEVGAVRDHAYAPVQYLSGNGYSIDLGVAFRCMKCLPHPVFTPGPRLPEPFNP